MDYPRIQRPLVALALGLKIGCLAYIVTILATAYAGSPPILVPDPRVLAGTVKPESPYGGANLSDTGYNVVESINGDGGSKTYRTWRLITTDIDQEPWLEKHIGRPVFAVGRRGERASQFYFLIDAIRETR